MTVTLRTLVLVVAGTLAALAGGVTLLVHAASGDDGAAAPAPALAPGVPALLSVEQLRALAENGEVPVYWAGAIPRRRIEVTASRDGTFLRYLPAQAAAGSQARALTIATYRLDRAWAVAQEAAAGAGARRATLPDGRVAVWRAGSPTSVYLAQPGSDVLVEVFDPRAETARHLSLTGQVQPVRAG